MPPLTISLATRRRFILGLQGLWPGRRWAGKGGTASALRASEGVQVDPVTVVAPSHDIVLWGRVAGYQPDHLDTLLYAGRQFFDCGGNLNIYPMDELPYHRLRMERYKVEKRWADFARDHPALLDDVRAEVRARGPLRKRDLAGRAINSYRAGKDSGLALHYLWLTGELMTHSRDGKERVYDFLENVAPPEWQWAAPAEDAVAHFTRKAIAHLGLVDERAFHYLRKHATGRPLTRPEGRATLQEMVAAGQLVPLHLENHKSLLYTLASSYPLLETVHAGAIPDAWQPLGPTTTDEVTFLSPLEYVSARGRAPALFDFDYIWEIYKPAAKRQYGPYTMPILYGDRLVARLAAFLDASAAPIRL